MLKQKLKLINGSLKEWHHQHSSNTNGKIRVVKEWMSSLDTKGETSALQEEEIAELHELSVNLHSLSRVQESMCWQKSRLNWLQESNANTRKKNHGVMSSRRRCNHIQLIQVNRVQVEGVQKIREAVFNHFSSHF